MATELISVGFHKIMQSRSYTVIILGTPQKKFAIYTDPSIGRTLQLLLTKEHPPRPLTHNLISSCFRGLNVEPFQVVITDVQDTIYFAHLFIEQQIGAVKQILEIDARPSDCIILALMHHLPVFCHKEVFDKVVPVEED